MYGFLLVLYSNFIPKMHRFFKYSTCKYTVTLKPGLGVTQGHGKLYHSIRYPWLLTSHSNIGVPRTVSEIKAISVENRQSFHSRVLWAPLKGFPWELGIGAPGQKARIMGYLAEKKLTISSAVRIQYTNVTDRQTDTGRQQRPRLRIVSRGNKWTSR